ncbi:hypothetical protein HOLleu_31576 [Holothuria leucospilota]|uniref:DNA helicase n=1 Tax=Holothuria leucospilota TaxID=206669 RepID=A0A9Q0YU97_HOLLE|nr:hypothetical protein HOLleu_31576 [Holothuria leucospilota]
MASLFDKFKFTPKTKAVLKSPKGSDVKTPCPSQDSDVTCIPETPSSDYQKSVEESPVFSAQSQRTILKTKADSSENSPTFSASSVSKKEGSVRRHLLTDASSEGMKRETPVGADAKEVAKDSDETYISGYGSDGITHSKNSMANGDVHSGDHAVETVTIDSDSDEGSPIIRKRKKFFSEETIDYEPEEKNIDKPRLKVVTNHVCDEELSDSDLDSPVVRTKKRRLLSPWDGESKWEGKERDTNTGPNFENLSEGDQVELDELKKDVETDEEEEDQIVRRSVKRRRVETMNSSVGEVEVMEENEGDKQIRQLQEMFPNHSIKELKKALDQSEESLDIAASILIDIPPKGEISDDDLPDPFSSSTSKQPSSTKGKDGTRSDVSSALSKFAYSGGWVSKDDYKSKPQKTKSPLKKPKEKIIQKKTKPAKKPARRRKRVLSSEDEEDEEDCSFVVDDDDVVDGDESHVEKIDLSDEEEEEEEDDDISSDEDGDDFGGEQFSESFQFEVLSFFNDASAEELEAINGCSKLKSQRIIRLRPFEDFADIVEKMERTPSLGIQLVENCEDIFSERQLLLEVLNECSATSQTIQATLAKEDQFLTNDKKIAFLDPSLSLKPYQIIGVNWMKLLHRHKVNGILADEMGLGKTIQVIAFLASLLEDGVEGPHLVVAPSSTLENWVREFNKWCPEMEVILYTGDRDYRMQLSEDIRYGALKCDVIVTSYNIAISEVDFKQFFKKIKIYYSVYDEGHMLKNVKSLRFKSLMKVKSCHKLLLTGTPLQNNLLELMSLISFVVPNLDNPEKTYTLQRVFSNVSGSEDSSFARDRINQAKQIMQPFVLRRIKDQVLDQLPTKIIEVEVCPMVPSQQEYYMELKSSLQKKARLKELNVASSDSKNTMSAVMELRKLANHPLLMRRLYTDEKLKQMSVLMLREPTHYDANAKLIEEDMSVMSDFELHLLCKQYYSVSSYRLDENMIRESGKFKALDKILPRLKEQSLKVLVFSQFVMMLDILEPYLKQCQHTYLRMDGSTPVSERGDVIDKFNNDPSVFVFLLSTKACGLGINLTVANTVILHDIDYNPHNDKQAEDRCHRVGQTREVKVIKLVSKGTIDESMLQRAQQKLHLEKQMTSDENNDERENVSIAKILEEALEIS